MATSTSEDRVERLGGAHRLTLLDAVAQSIGFMGPVFSIAFLVPLLVGLNASGKGAGAAAPLSVIIAAVGVLALGWIVAQYAKRIHAAGSLYDYVSEGLGVRVGAATGLLYYLGILALGAGILVMISGTIYDTIQGEFGSTPLPRLVWDLIVFAFIAVVLYLGVALSTRAQFVLAMISLTVVFVFFLYTIIKVGAGNHVATALKSSSSAQGINGVLFGVLYGVLLFTGFETAANLGEETEHPKRDIPRAVLIAVLTISGFYVLGAYAQVAGYHYNMNTLGKNAAAPLFGLAGPTSGGGFGSVTLRRVVELVVVFDMLAVLIGCSVAASRGFFAMARDRRLPPVLGKVSGQGTPLYAGIAVLVTYLLTIVFTRSWTGLLAQQGLPHYVAIFSWLSTFGGFALVTIYLFMSIGAIRSLGRFATPWAVYLSGAVGILITAAAIFGSVYKVAAPISYVPYVGLLALLVGFGITFVFHGRPTLITTYGELTDADQGPVKL